MVGGAKAGGIMSCSLGRKVRKESLKKKEILQKQQTTIRKKKLKVGG